MISHFKGGRVSGPPSVAQSGQPRRAGVLCYKAASLLVLALLLGTVPASAQLVVLAQSPGGIPVGGAYPTFNSGYGNINGLGVGIPAAGLTVLTAGVAGGVLYTTPYDMIFTLGGGNPMAVSVYVSTNFTNPAALSLQSCYPSAGCTAAGSYTTISTNVAAPTVVIPPPGIAVDSTVTASLALFVSNASGAGAFSGSDTATLTFLILDGTNGSLQDQFDLTLNSPSENVQTAVQLFLASAPGGLPIAPAADYSMNYGNVNGLGIGPGPGLSIVPSPGGVIYSTPYLIQPSFSSFISATSSLTVYVSLDFVNPVILELRDAPVLAGPYTAISKLVGTPTTLTTAAGSGTSFTRYLGLFVSNINGAAAFTGADSATLTYTLTVP